MPSRLAAALVGAALAVPGAAVADTVHVYSSLPLQGAAATQTHAAVRGMRLALAQAGGKAGPFDVKFVALDDSTRAAGNWDPARVSVNARRAVQDPRTVLYLGEFNSGASAISIPILNQGSIPQISPSNTYNGLTTGEAGTCCGEPGRYYPIGVRTYFRIVPRDTVQAAALVTAMRGSGCRSVAVGHDGDTYGRGMAVAVARQARRLHLPVALRLGRTRGHRPAALGARVARAGADCFFWGGVTANGAVRLFKAVATRDQHVRLFGADGICESGFSRPARRLARRFRCTVATIPIDLFPGGALFLGAYRQMFPGALEDPYAIFGYEAMKVGLDAIAAAGARGDEPRQVLRRLRQVRDRQSVLGTYSFDRHGDTTLRTYGVYRFTSAGRLVFDHALQAGR